MRTIIEKYQRLESLLQQYSEQIEVLGKKQVEIMQKVIREFNLQNDSEHGYSYRKYLEYDFIKIGEGGAVELWERGRCGDNDSYETEFHLDHRIIAGDLAGYEASLRKQHEGKRLAMQATKLKEKENKRQALEKDLARITKELNKLGD